jgi:DNA polymerase-4
VQVGRRRRSIGSQRALGRRPRSHEELDLTLIGIVDRLGRRLRAAHRVCRTVILRLRFADYSRATRSHTMPDPTAQTREILDTARGLLAAAAPLIETRGLTLIGLSLTNLENETPLQLPLPLDRRDDTALDAALDLIRDRFGSSAVTRAVLLGRDSGFAMPLLPD